MALRYAVANGLWSDTATWDGGTLPTSSDDVYANGYTVDIDMNVDVLSIRNEAGAPAVAGGTFILGENITLTCTGGGLISGTVTLLTWSGGVGTTSNIVTTDIVGGTGAADTKYVRINGLGTINIISNTIIGAILSGNSGTIVIDTNCVINVIGDLIGPANGAGSNRSCIRVNSDCTLHITGAILANNIDVNFRTIDIRATCSIEIIGSISSSSTVAVNSKPIISNGYLKIIGPISTTFLTTIESSSTSAINLFSGPFICGEYGTMPYLCARMHLIPSLGTYFEFRDETTNGALSPGAIAPATRLITLGATVDAPDEIDVRDGVLYASASLEGSAVIPHEDNVAYNVPVDHTVGTQLISPEDVWNTLVSSLTTPDSLGERLKNCSTVDTMGAQLEALN